MPNAELYAQLEQEYRHRADVLPEYAAQDLDMARWCAEMAAGYQAYGESWLPF